MSMLQFPIRFDPNEVSDICQHSHTLRLPTYMSFCHKSCISTWHLAPSITGYKSKPSNMRSDWRNLPPVVDLTDDADENENANLPSLPTAANRFARLDMPFPPSSGPNPPISASQPRNAYYPPLPGSTPQYAERPYTSPAVMQLGQTSYGGLPLPVSRPASGHGKPHNHALLNNYLPVPGHFYNSHAYNAPFEVEREAKRLRIEPEAPLSLPLARTSPVQQTEVGRFHSPGNVNYFAGPIQEPRDDDIDSVISEISASGAPIPQNPRGSAVVRHQTAFDFTYPHPAASIPASQTSNAF